MLVSCTCDLCAERPESVNFCIGFMFPSDVILIPILAVFERFGKQGVYCVIIFYTSGGLLLFCVTSTSACEISMFFVEFVLFYLMI